MTVPVRIRISIGAIVVLSAALALGCGAGAGSGGGAAIPTAPEVVFQGESATVPLTDLTKRGPLTVLLFFSAECPVQKAHDARFRQLVSLYEPKGVSFAAVISEVGTNLDADRAEARRRGYTMPVLEDRGAVLADALGVEYSTHVLVLEPSRRVLYSGAIDSDRTHLTASAEPYLREAIEAALAGHEASKPRVEALGCALRKH